MRNNHIIYTTKVININKLIKQFPDTDLLNPLNMQFKLQTLKKEKETAKKEGLIVNSIDKLTCKIHPDTAFRKIDIINGSESWINKYDKKYKEGLNIYQCKECSKNKDIKEKSKAYDCPYCGIVLGKFKTIDYFYKKEQLEKEYNQVIPPTGLSDGLEYYCRICGTELGHEHWCYID